MQVPLHHQLHLPGALQHLPDLGRVMDARLVLGVELLVEDRHARAVRRRERRPQELHLLSGYERLLPRELASAVRHAVWAVAGVQHDERDPVADERIERLGLRLPLVRHLGQELLL